jgi:hypothetical protein
LHARLRNYSINDIARGQFEKGATGEHFLNAPQLSLENFGSREVKPGFASTGTETV